MTRISQLAAILMVGAVHLQGERRLVVSIPDCKLAFVVDGEVKKVYAVAVGKTRTPSPHGTFTVVNRVKHPTWYGPGQVVEPGPQNPLGTRWLGLSHKGYGVHGTNVPRSIGKAASHGCIRMRNEDVEELFEIVQTGDVVELVPERNEEIAKLFEQPAPSTIASIAIPAMRGAE
jgi:lipoprotein-anchoring transpeptidase ErfK/SrfK